MEICEDVWTPIPPSSRAALAGATVLLNLSASNAIVGKSDYRQTLCAAHSGRCLAAYLYSAAGQGESTTDLAWDGEAMIYENGDLLAKAPRFSDTPQLVVADVDTGRLMAERARQGTFGDCADVEAPTFGFPPRRVRTRRAARCRPRPDAQCPALSFRAGRRVAACRALLRGVQHSGAWARAKAARVGHAQGRHRRVGRSRLHAGAAGRGDGDGAARPAARKHPRLYAAGLRARRTARKATPGG